MEKEREMDKVGMGRRKRKGGRGREGRREQRGGREKRLKPAPIVSTDRLLVSLYTCNGLSKVLYV